MDTLSAARARDGGLDGVGISMAHGYLFAQFFNPLLNHRDDRYGGDLAGRMRFAVEVLSAETVSGGSATRRTPT